MANEAGLPEVPDWKGILVESARREDGPLDEFLAQILGSMEPGDAADE